MTFLILLLLGNVYDDTPLTVNPDPNYVPGTYAEYRAEQPEYVELSVTPIVEDTRGVDFLIIMEDGMSAHLDKDLIAQWRRDIAIEGNTSAVVEITYSDPVEIRNWLKGLYAGGLKGIVLVGDIPAPWSFKELQGHAESFPSDYFYMDLDGTWEDKWIGDPVNGTAGQDSIYDGWSGSLAPEIYAGRIKTSKLYAADKYELIESYLKRLHTWRLQGDPRITALCYVDDPWKSYGNEYQTGMLNLYDTVELVTDKAATNGDDYKVRLQAKYTWISPFVHSSPTLHAWEPGPATTNVYIWLNKPLSRFYNLFACSNCRFTTTRNMGLTYVFGNDYGLAAIGSTKSGAMLRFEFFYNPLGKGKSLGEAYQAWWTQIMKSGFSNSEEGWHLGMVVLGDPTIMPAMHMLGIEDDASVPAPSIHFSSNPATGAVTITSGGEFSIHDMTGRKLRDGYLSENVTDLQTGIYLVRAENQGVTVTEKLCIIR